MKRYTSISLLIMLLARHAGGANESPYTVESGNTAAIRKMENNWMADNRFGMFITFGLYSLPAGVWNGEEMGRNHYA